MELKTLDQVAAYLATREEPELKACAAVCNRVIAERQELLSAVTRLSKRLARCTAELDRAARGLK